MGIHPQPHHAHIVWLRLGDDLDGGALLLRFLGDVTVTEVFPEAAIAGNGFQCVESLGRQPRHTGLLGVTVGHVGPAGFVLILRPEKVLGFVANRIEVLFNVEVEFERVRGERFFHLRFAIKRQFSVAGHVECLGRKLRWFSRALDGEQDFVEEAQDGGIEILFIALLFLFQLIPLGMALGNATIGLLRGIDMASRFLNASHGGFVAGQDAEIVFLAQAVEKLLNFFWRDFRVRADDDEDVIFA